MVRYLKRRREHPAYYSAEDQRQRVIDTHRVKRCGVCTYEFPEEDMIVEDGIEKCPMCKDRYTAEYLAYEQEFVAEVKAESARRLNDPVQFSVRAEEVIPGAVTLITDSAGNVLSQTSPLRMIRSDLDPPPPGIVVTVLLIGQRFTSANVTTYASGIRDDSPPVITSELITLSLLAAESVTPGAYGITVADGVSTYGHEFPMILAVR